MSDYYRSTAPNVTSLVGGLVADALIDSRTGSVSHLHADILSAASDYDGECGGDPLRNRIIVREQRLQTAAALRQVARTLLIELGGAGA